GPSSGSSPAPARQNAGRPGRRAAPAGRSPAIPSPPASGRRAGWESSPVPPASRGDGTEVLLAQRRSREAAPVPRGGAGKARTRGRRPPVRQPREELRRRLVGHAAGVQGE